MKSIYKVIYDFLPKDGSWVTDDELYTQFKDYVDVNGLVVNGEIFINCLIFLLENNVIGWLEIDENEFWICLLYAKDVIFR